MKQPLIQKLGASLGILAFLGICAAFVIAPSSCSLNPEQRARLQAISVPAAGILSKAAVSQGWVQPGDEITIQRGVAIVTKEGTAETKLFELAELGLTHALQNGTVTEGDVLTLTDPQTLSILMPDSLGPILPLPDNPLPDNPLPDKPLPSLLPALDEP